MKENKKPKYNVRQCVAYMLRTAWREEKSVLWMCLIYAGLSLAISLAQLFLAPVVLEKVEVLVPLGELLGTIAFFSLALILLTGLLGYVDQNIMFGRIDVRSAIINDLNEKTCTTSYPNTLDPDLQKLLEKAMDSCNSNSAPGEHIWHTLTGLVLNVGGFAVYLTLLSGLDPVLIAVVVLTTALGFFVSRNINEWGYRHREEETEYENQMAYIRRRTESTELAKDIRIFGLAGWLQDIHRSAMELYEAFLGRRERVYLWTCVVDMVLSIARNGIAYLYLIHMALENQLSASEFLLYFSAFTGFSQWVTGILDECSRLHKECLEISAIQEYLNLPEQFRFEGGVEIPKGDRYELKLENVTFCYPGTQTPILRDLNLTLRPGEKLAIVGLNGAGKTTLVKLVCGFYDPDQGRVLLNGIDIREFNRREYYDLFSAVFQDFSDLDVTVAQGVAQRVDNIDMEKVASCIRKAGLTEMMDSLPQGYDTHLGKNVFPDGIQLSGGQHQRLMLARALYKDGPFLILDEPTAALDPIAENDIYRKYNEMTEGKSSVFISHRLASTRFCDRILFLQGGVIAEEGTHEELIRLGGGYAKLFAVQARYYQEGREFDGEEI